jgi:hypothetical protein
MSELPTWSFPIVDDGKRVEKAWFEFFRFAARRLKLPELPSYTVAQLGAAPMTAAGNPRCLVFVSDEAGGATVAFSDGTDWRRVQDRAVVS